MAVGVSEAVGASWVPVDSVPALGEVSVADPPSVDADAEGAEAPSVVELAAGAVAADVSATPVYSPSATAGNDVVASESESKPERTRRDVL